MLNPDAAGGPRIKSWIQLIEMVQLILFDVGIDTQYKQ